MKIDKEKLERSEFTKTVRRDAPEFAQEFEAFKAQWSTFWTRDAAMVGKVLTSHAAVEFYLERFICSVNPYLGSMDRLSYAHMVELANSDKLLVMKYLYPGMRALGKIRNALAHEITSELPKAPLDELKLLLGPWRVFMKSEAKDDADVCAEFAYMACMFLNSVANWCARYGGDKGYAGYSEWVGNALRDVFPGNVAAERDQV